MLQQTLCNWKLYHQLNIWSRLTFNNEHTEVLPIIKVAN